MNCKKYYINLKGGLGNQFFQFVFGLYLTKIGIQISGYYFNYENDTYGRSFLLKNLSIKKIIECNPSPDTIILKSEVEKLIVDYIKNSPDGEYLIDGYFQNIKYISTINILEEITPIKKVNPLTAIHLRRVDHAHHGVLSLQYYYDALNFFKKIQILLFIAMNRISLIITSKISKGFNWLLPQT